MSCLSEGLGGGGKKRKCRDFPAVHVRRDDLFDHGFTNFAYICKGFFVR